ncbi:MAG: tripartite tricarboxylate transporter substrate binding protein [Lachnospiraceae bacterium]|nr:tripartite tricarboxylate transporter substrate binding protein [Lachnospiraceae bacterium]
MKKIGVVLLSALMLTSLLAGCSQPAASSQPAETKAAETQAAAAADAYPGGKNIDAIVAFAAGSATDLNLRLLASYLEDELGTSVTVQNKEGGGGEIGWTALANSKNDGYTIGMLNSPCFQLPISNADTCKFTIDSFIPIGNMVTDPGCVVVAADSEINSLEDMVAYAKDHPGEITVATTGMKTSEARACNTLAAERGVQFQIVPYDGSTEAINAVVGGHCMVAWQNVGDIMTQLDQGTIKPIAVGSPERSEILPDVPTFAEQGLDFNQFSMRTLAVPAGTDPEIVKTLEAAMAKAMQNPEFIKKAEESNILLDYQDSASMIQIYKDLDAQWRAEWAERPWQ